MKEFEFHIPPASSSSRPQTGVGTDGASASSRRARSGSSLSRRGSLDEAAADRALADDAAVGAVAWADRRRLDYVPPFGTRTSSAEW